MNKLLVAAAVWAFGITGPALAAGAPVCPARAPQEDAASYTPKAQSYCEARWSDLVAANKTGQRTHDKFIDSCAAKCVGNGYGAHSGQSLAVVGLGLAAAGGVAAAAASGSGSHPASP
jgi:hypothetical protein